MGCGGSKQKKCRQCEGEYPSSSRSFSMNVHHPPISKGDSYHVVALTSSTLGSIKLDPPSMILIGDNSNCIDNDDKWRNHYNGICENIDIDINEAKAWSKMIDPKIPILGTKKHSQGIDIDVNEARAWSKMIDKKIPMVGMRKKCPKTPITTPPEEPETIDVDDLMKDLECYSPIRYDERGSFTFHASTDDLHVVDTPKGMEESGFDNQEKENNVLNEILDPEVVPSFRKAFEELSPTNPFFLQRRGCDQYDQWLTNGVLGEHIESNGQTQENNSIAREVVDPNNGYDHLNGFVGMLDNGVVPYTNGYPNDGIVSDYKDKFSSKKEKVILYFTSLRGVRKTYEDCCYVKLILKGYRVRVDERDVSMHSGFKQELKERLGEWFKAGLPKVFAGERYIGGAEEMRQLHEDGLLEKVFKDCQSSEDHSGNFIDACEACGNVRFIPCKTCSGSCKIYYEYEDFDGEYEEDDYGFQRCPDCNENGLIRCPFCCD